MGGTTELLKRLGAMDPASAAVDRERAERSLDGRHRAGLPCPDTGVSVALEKGQRPSLQPRNMARGFGIPKTSELLSLLKLPLKAVIFFPSIVTDTPSLRTEQRTVLGL